MGQFVAREERIKAIEEIHRINCKLDSDCTDGMAFNTYVLKYEDEVCQHDVGLIDTGYYWYTKQECQEWCDKTLECKGIMIFTGGPNVGTCQIRSDCYKSMGDDTKHVGARFFEKRTPTTQQQFEIASKTCCARAVLMKIDEKNSNFLNYRNYIASLNLHLGGYHKGRWPTE